MIDRTTLEAAQVKALVIIAGYMLPVDDLGTTLQFDLVAYPCDPGILQQAIIKAIGCEMTLKYSFESQPIDLPDALLLRGEQEYLERGMGLRFWFLDSADDIAFLLRRSHCFSKTRIFKAFQKRINLLACRETDFIYRLGTLYRNRYCTDFMCDD